MNKKIIFSIVILGGLFFITSCKNFLQEDLTTKPTRSYYSSSAKGFESGINAIYRYLRAIYPGDHSQTEWSGEEGQGPASLSVMGTDTYTHGSDADYKGINNYDKRLSASNSAIQGYWRTCYLAINQANAMIAKDSLDIPGLSNDVKTERIAEAHFLRALFYFDLVRQFGSVTLTLKPTKGIKIKATRTPANEIYSKAIIPDAKFAINHLPDTQSDYGRPTKPAAQMLLSKVLLTRGYNDFAQPTDFKMAATLAEDVIHNYNFKLLDNYKDVFDINNQKNKEVIWSVQYTKNLKLDGGGNWLHVAFLMLYDIQPGMKRDIANGRPFKVFKPTKFLLSLWNRKIDTRWDADFKRVFYCNNPSTAPPGVSLGDTDIYLPGHEVSQAFRDSKPYMIITPSQYTQKLFPTLTKYLDPTRETVSQIQGQRDFMVWRLAGTYLTAAEAYFKMGNKVKAAKALNAVRKRAAKPGKESAMEISPSDVTLNFILNERARELVGEFHRWFTLKRTHTLIKRVRAHNLDAAQNIQLYHRLRPVPQQQIDRTKGHYGQNSGY
jgi:hypothetical protein